MANHTLRKNYTNLYAFLKMQARKSSGRRFV